MLGRVIDLAVTLFVISVPVVAWSVNIGVAVTASHILGLGLVGLAAAAWVVDRRSLPMDVATFSAVAYLVVAALSVVVAQREPNLHLFDETSHLKSIKQFVGLCFGVSVFLALRCVLAWYDRGWSALMVHFWTTAVFAVLTFVQYAVALVDLDSPLANFAVLNSTLGTTRPLSLMYEFPRVSLTLVEPSFLATYLLPGWAFWLYTVGSAPTNPAGRQRLFTAAGMLIGAAIVITGSRLAYVVVAVLLASVLAVRPRRLYRTGVVAGSLLAGLLLTGPVHGQQLVASLVPEVAPARSAVGVDSRTDQGMGVRAYVEAASGTLDVSVQQRMASYLVGLDVLRSHPVLGTGFGTSTFYMYQLWPAQFTPLAYGHPVPPTMLSFYATVASETGLLGLLCVVGLGVGVCLRLRRLAGRSAADSTLAWGLAGVLFACALTGLGTPLVVYQILVLSLLLAVSLTARTRPGPSSERETQAGSGRVVEEAGGGRLASTSG